MPPRRHPANRRHTLLATLAALALLQLGVGLAVAAPAGASPAAAPPPAATNAATAPTAWLPLGSSATSRRVAPAVAAAPIRLTPIPAEALAAVAGGTCTTCSSDDGSSSGGGGGGGGTGSSGSPMPVGSPYWTTYRVDLTSSSYSPASLASRINNWSGVTINGTFGYTRKVVRDVQFSGGYASFVSASVGGEVSLSTSASVSYPVPPMSYGKLYVKYYTARKTFYGHEYQDYNDGSRTIVASDKGPYQSTSTVLGYVTGPL